MRDDMPPSTGMGTDFDWGFLVPESFDFGILLLSAPPL